jgi:hypothetical protein
MGYSYSAQRVTTPPSRSRRARKVDKGSVSTLGGGASRFAYVYFRGGRGHDILWKGILISLPGPRRGIVTVSFNVDDPTHYNRVLSHIFAVAVCFAKSCQFLRQPGPYTIRTLT